MFVKEDRGEVEVTRRASLRPQPVGGATVFGVLEPRSGVRKVGSFGEFSKVMLDDHRFAIVRPGFATVIPARGGRVHGVLWRLTPRDLTVLDAYENIGSGMYGRDERRVWQDGRSLRAIVYFARDPRPARAKPGYLEDCVLPAARHWGLPQAHVAAIEAWVTAPGARPSWNEARPL